MALIFTYPLVEKPAPRFEGQALADELQRLIDDSFDPAPELCLIVGGEKGGVFPRRQLIRQKCKVRSDGTISLVARRAGACFCHHTEEKFHFSPESVPFLVLDGCITAMVVGYPWYQVFTAIENTHDGSRRVFDITGRLLKDREVNELFPVQKSQPSELPPQPQAA